MPIFKKGEEARVEDYRGCYNNALYKIYIAILAERLRQKVEERCRTRREGK